MSGERRGGDDEGEECMLTASTLDKKFFACQSRYGSGVSNPNMDRVSHRYGSVSCQSRYKSVSIQIWIGCLKSRSGSVSHLHLVSEEDVESSGHGIRTSMEAHRHLVISVIFSSSIRIIAIATTMTEITH